SGSRRSGSGGSGRLRCGDRRLGGAPVVRPPSWREERSMSDTYDDQLKDWEHLLAAVRGEDPPDQVPDRELDIAEIVQEARSVLASTSWREAEIEEARASGRAVVKEGTEQ